MNLYTCLVLVLLLAVVPPNQLATAEDSETFECGHLLGEITTPSGKLVACTGAEVGSPTAPLENIDIALISPKKTYDLVFQSDDALKYYKIEKVTDSFTLLESYASLEGFKPFMQLQVSCAKRCRVKDIKCVYKRMTKQQRLDLTARVSKKHCTKSRDAEACLELHFKLALEGVKGSLKFFDSEGGSLDGGVGEEFETRKQDLRRVKALGCLN